MSADVWTVVAQSNGRSLVEIRQRDGLIWVAGGLSAAELYAVAQDLARQLYLASQLAQKEPA